MKSSQPPGREAGQAVWEMLKKGFLLPASGWTLTSYEAVRGTGCMPGLCSNPTPIYTVQPKASYLISLSFRFLFCKGARTSLISKVCDGLCQFYVSQFCLMAIPQAPPGRALPFPVCYHSQCWGGQVFVAAAAPAALESGMRWGSGSATY